jgi:hypothetical protein
MALQHGVLHNALRSWVGPAGGYRTDTLYLGEGRYRLEDFKNLYELVVASAGKVGLKEVKGTVLVKE